MFIKNKDNMYFKNIFNSTETKKTNVNLQLINSDKKKTVTQNNNSDINIQLLMFFYPLLFLLQFYVKMIVNKPLF